MEIESVIIIGIVNFCKGRTSWNIDNVMVGYLCMFITLINAFAICSRFT